MKLLEERIQKEGIIAPGDVLRVDSFLNHQIDVVFMKKLAEEFYHLYQTTSVDKVVTVEASGISIASFVALEFGVPLVFAKKSRSSNVPGSVYSAPVKSFTHGDVHDISISRNYLHAGEKILLIDDFLARGEALHGLMDLVRQAGAEVVGCGVLVEKRYQGGGDSIRAQGVRVEALARIESMSVENGLVFS